MQDADLAAFLPYARMSRVGGVALSLVCLAIAGVGFVDDTASLGVQLGLLIPFGGFAIVMLYLTFRSPLKHAAIVALRTRSQDIVWIYPSTQSVNGVHSQTFVNLGLSDGKQRALAIGKKTDPTPLIDRLSTLLPHASVGYSPDLEKQFKTNPSALRRA